MTPDPQADKLDAFEASIGYRFKNRQLLIESLTHPSLNVRSSDEGRDYQRLEFLGDAVIQYLLTRELYHQHREDNEDALTRDRSALARGVSLAGIAREIGLPDVLRMSDGEYARDGHQRTSALEDGLEALIGALHEDAGLERTAEIVLGWYGPLQRRLEPLKKWQNPKGRLQEKVQPVYGTNPLVYRVVRTLGDPHCREFEVEVSLEGRLLGTGAGSTKRKAEETAAMEALETLETEGLT
jgi:ribonuclease-3